MMTLSWEIVQTAATEAGFDLVGVAQVGAAPRWSAYRDWVAQGYAGTLDYLTHSAAVKQRADPRVMLPEARAVLVVGAAYGRAMPPELLPALHGRVSRYAWGEDYHRWLLRRLKALVRALQACVGPFPARCYVDTGPLLERAWAEAAGLGWIGKNALLLHPQVGSYFFLGVALLGVEVEPSPPRCFPICGSCTRCLDACPTGALVAPGVVDARRCLAYLTVELRGAIPAALRPALGAQVFGCDLCQEACPWNYKVLQTCAAIPAPLEASLYLPALLTLESVEFRARFRQTALWRAAPEGLARNAAIVLGNRGDSAALPALCHASQTSPSDLVREAAAWAVARLSGGSNCTFFYRTLTSTRSGSSRKKT